MKIFTPVLRVGCAWLLILPLLVLAEAPAPGAPRPNAAAVASAHPLATDAGLEVLAAGGNAFDAAVAVSAAIAVVEPTGSGIGGGGFWLLHRASDQYEVVVDGRETAPMAARADMYLDAQGRARPEASLNGALAGAIPGEPAALEHIAQRYGKLPLSRLLQPAIRYARDGFACDHKLAEAFARNWKRLSPEARAVFAVDGMPPRQGDLLRQPDLARTLEAMARSGAAGFYEGEVGKKLVAGVRANGGIWSAEDLRRYRVVEREPTVLWYRDVRIVTAPPPSAGAITLGEIFNQLEVLGWSSGTLQSKHELVETMRRAYRDRAAYLGDPDFVHIPMTQLLSRGYARQLAASIDPRRATPSASLPPATPSPQGTNTTHLSVLDAEGNRVSATLSINYSFGSGFIPAGTGVFVNDEMDDFAAATTASNVYGLIGSEANLVAPGKRPLSSMSPSFAEGPNGLLVIGTPGGSRIITMVLLGLLDWIDGGSARQIVSLPRFHNQYLPDQIEYEPGAFSDADLAALRQMGHRLKPVEDGYGNMQVVTWNPRTGAVEAAADPRAVGAGRVLGSPASAAAAH